MNFLQESKSIRFGNKIVSVSSGGFIRILKVNPKLSYFHEFYHQLLNSNLKRKKNLSRILKSPKKCLKLPGLIKINLILMLVLMGTLEHKALNIDIACLSIKQRRILGYLQLKATKINSLCHRYPKTFIDLISRLRKVATKDNLIKMRDLKLLECNFKDKSLFDHRLFKKIHKSFCEPRNENFVLDFEGKYRRILDLKENDDVSEISENLFYPEKQLYNNYFYLKLFNIEFPEIDEKAFITDVEKKIKKNIEGLIEKTRNSRRESNDKNSSGRQNNLC